MFTPRCSKHVPVLLLVLLGGSSASAQSFAFHVSFDGKAHARPFTGRVHVMLFKEDHKDLQKGTSWFNPQPCFARDVKNVAPGQVVVLDRTALAYPVSLDRLPAGSYCVQAVMDLHANHINFSTAPGNVYTIQNSVRIDPKTTGPLRLHLDRVYQARPFVENDRVKFVEIESKLLSAFHGRPTHLRAGVVLPGSYAKNKDRKYPIVYEIPGFSGTHHMAHSALARDATDLVGLEVLHVVLDPSCRHGHHVFADSANNGPVGRALIEELIPAIESRFRAVGKPEARLVTGHSSGGWSSLWLQITYPEHFAGCWSTAPDPVDFRDFQKINLYRPGENMFVDSTGQKRPIARKGDKPVLYYKPFSDMEELMGHGGQLASFEGVFSKRGPDGQPRRLWNRQTGAIDLEVARSWEKYDIRLVLERNWTTLEPALRGKIHVYMGDRDTFYLEGATILLAQTMKKLNSDAVVEIFPGKDHSSLMDRAMRRRIAQEMETRLRANKVVE